MENQAGRARDVHERHDLRADGEDQIRMKMYPVSHEKKPRAEPQSRKESKAVYQPTNAVFDERSTEVNEKTQLQARQLQIR
jgi:hypothetical protein